MSRYHASLPRGFCKGRLRARRAQLGLRGRVDIHHIVPREFKGHPVLRRELYDVEAGYNLILLPVHDSSGVRTRRPVHTNGHGAYNEFVHSQLSTCADTASLVALLWVLHSLCRGWGRWYGASLADGSSRL